MLAVAACLVALCLALTPVAAAETVDAADVRQEREQALVNDAVAAHQAGSTSQTAPMLAMEAVVRSRNPRGFVIGLGYLDGLLGSRVAGAGTVERWVAELGRAERERDIAAAAQAIAQAAIAEAEPQVPRRKVQLRVAFAAHAGRAGQRDADLARLLARRCRYSRAV